MSSELTLCTLPFYLASGGDNEANSGRLNGAAFENNEVKNEQTNFDSQPSTLLDANDEW